MPINYKDYPKDWKDIRKKILKRADDKCEWCGVENGAEGYRNIAGIFHRLRSVALKKAKIDFNSHHKIIKIVLTVAHLDHTVGNESDKNLAALCQKCHLGHDRKLHTRNRKYGRDAFGKNQLKLKI